MFSETRGCGIAAMETEDKKRMNEGLNERSLKE